MQEKLAFICYFNKNFTGIYEENYKEFLEYANKSEKNKPINQLGMSQWKRTMPHTCCMQGCGDEIARQRTKFTGKRGGVLPDEIQNDCQ